MNQSGNAAPGQRMLLPDADRTLFPQSMQRSCLGYQSNFTQTLVMRDCPPLYQRQGVSEVDLDSSGFSRGKELRNSGGTAGRPEEVASLFPMVG